MGETSLALFAYALALVAHYDYALTLKLGGVDILAIEHRAINRHPALLRPIEELGEWQIVDSDSKYGTHGGLYDLGIVAVGAIRRAEYIAYAKPVGKTYYSAKIARILHPV